MIVPHLSWFILKFDHTKVMISTVFIGVFAVFVPYLRCPIHKSDGVHTGKNASEKKVKAEFRKILMPYPGWEYQSLYCSRLWSRVPAHLATQKCELPQFVRTAQKKPLCKKYLVLSGVAQH